MRAVLGRTGPRGWSLLGRLFAAWRVAWRSGRWHFLLLAALAVITGLVPAAIAWLTKAMVDGLIAGRPVVELGVLAAGLIVSGLVIGTLPHVTTYLGGEVDRRCNLLLTDRLYAAVNSFNGLARFEDPRMLDDIRMAEQAAAGSVGPTTSGTISLGKDALTLLSLLATLWVLAPVMAAVVVGSAVPLLIAQVSLSRHHVRTLARLNPASRRQFFYSSLIGEADAAMEVRLLSLGGFFKSRMLAELLTVHRGERGVERRRLIVQGLCALLGAGISGGGLAWAIVAASSHQISVGTISAFIAAVAGAQGALTGLVMQIAQTHQALLIFDCYMKIVELPDDLPTPAPPHDPLPALRRGIELHDVWFRYDANHPWVLRGVNLRIPHGEAVALVGLNGAGKSTLVKLLCRFYDPTVGRITWDGIDIRAVPATELRRRMAVVFQEFMRYDMTAAENVGVGDLPQFENLEAVRHAAATVGIDEKLRSLPAGYHTMLTRTFFSAQESAEHGVLLSAGQWQRLALARTLMRADADLLILDEPSSGLDAEAEHQIHQRLRALRSGRTSVLISHRLSAIREADRIAVLDRGRIVEQGTHTELMQRGGRYAYLFSLQARGYQAGHEHDTVPAPAARPGPVAISDVLEPAAPACRGAAPTHPNP